MERIGDFLDQQVAQAVVGRDRALAVLSECLAPNGPRVCYVHGIPGIGKSALLQAFAAELRASGAFVAAHGSGGGGSGPGAVQHGSLPLVGLPQEPLAAIAATLIHTGGYLLVTGLVTLVVYEKLGLRFLRSAWINLDLLWAGGLIVTAILTPFL